MLMRSLGVITFIAITAATGIYFWQRPTIASGEAIAADLVEANPHVKEMTCDERIPIGMAGATFHCVVELKTGAVGRLKFVYDRNGAITELPVVEDPLPVPPVEKTGDPWAD
jgi:hypothetical protein